MTPSPIAPQRPAAPAALAHFESLYAASEDPWQVRQSWYEQRKRNLLLACLDRAHYGRVFEPGCGNGEMSAALAARCEVLLACDGAASAAAAAQRRVDQAGVDGCEVRIEQRRLPDQWPLNQSFDLIVISELAYYFDDAGVAALAALAAASLADGGLLVLCHWRHDFADRVSSTDLVHAAFGAAAGLRPRLQHLEEDFRLDTWVKGAPGSAA